MGDTSNAQKDAVKSYGFGSITEDAKAYIDKDCQAKREDANFETTLTPEKEHRKI